jgi:phosphoglucosamine mutase
MGRLFGTDGVRGTAGEYPLDPATIRRLGAALARALGPASAQGARKAGTRFLAGRDTRESGAWIERELALGIASQGGTLTSAGIVPTPAVAFLTPRTGYTAGVVISASHNPFHDNGIKVFSGAGEKFTEALEAQVEAIVSDQSCSTATRAARRSAIMSTTPSARCAIRASASARTSRRRCFSPSRTNTTGASWWSKTTTACTPSSCPPAT